MHPVRHNNIQKTTETYQSEQDVHWRAAHV